jgi:2'-5' RNA ligase
MGESQNWYEIPVTLPERYKTWVRDNVKPEDIASVEENHHITLLYGFDPAAYDQVKALADSFGPFGDDFKFGEVRDGDVAPVKFVPIHSDTLQRCFATLSKVFKHKHYVHNGQFIPHVTLCTLKSQ